MWSFLLSSVIAINITRTAFCLLLSPAVSICLGKDYTHFGKRQGQRGQDDAFSFLHPFSPLSSIL